MTTSNVAVDVYTVHTLIDITDSGILTPKTDVTGFFQAQNLNTFIQSIGIRSQPLETSVSMVSAEDVELYEFGKEFTGLHDIWIITFKSDTAEAWKSVNNDVYLLQQDLDNTPIHSPLNETAFIADDIIKTKSVLKNTYFKISHKA